MSMEIPEEHCLMPNGISPSMKEPSKCHHELLGLSDKEIVGCAPLLNASSEEITRFFLTHVEKPTVFVQVDGWHVVRTRSGKSNTPSTRNVTDFL